MNIPLEPLLGIIFLLLGAERIIPNNLPPWVVGALLVIAGLLILL